MAQLGGPSGRALQDGAGGAGSRGLLQQGGLRDDEAALALITEEEEPAGDAAGLWGQREDKQVQVGARAAGALVLPLLLLLLLLAVCWQRLAVGCWGLRRWNAHSCLVSVRPSLPPSSVLFHHSQSLLEAVSVGAASMQELQERLQAELAALEVRTWRGRRAGRRAFRQAGGREPAATASSHASTPWPPNAHVPPTRLALCLAPIRTQACTRCWRAER